MIYWFYLIITISVTIVIVGGQILFIVNEIYNSILTGSGFSEILGDYSNLFVITGMGIIGKVVKKIKKSHKKGMD